MSAATFMAAPERLSMSFLKRHAQCPRRAQAEREADFGSDLSTIGRVAHEIFATCGTAASMKGLTQLPPEQVLAIAGRVLRNPEEHDPLSREAHRDLMQVVQRFARWHRFPADAQFEVSSRQPLAGRVFSARIDVLALDGETVEIRDYKTGPNLPSKPKPGEPPMLTFQGENYCWHARRLYPQATRFFFTEEWVRYGVWRGPVEVLADELDEHEDYLRIQIDRVDRAYSTGVLEARPGSWCSGCPVKLDCPVPGWARPASGIESEQDVAAQLEAILVESARVDERKKLIRAWMRDNDRGLVTVGDRAIGFHAAPSKRLDEAAAAAAGVNLDDFRSETVSTTFKIGAAQ